MLIKDSFVMNENNPGQASQDNGARKLSLYSHSDSKSKQALAPLLCTASDHFFVVLLAFALGHSFCGYFLYAFL